MSAMSLVFIQKLSSETQNSGCESVLCRHTIENTQCSLLGIYYIFLKKNYKEEESDEIQKKLPTRYAWENNFIIAERNTQKLTLTFYCVGKADLYFSSYSSSKKFQVVLKSC